MATGITISILQQYFSRLIVKFLNCTSELLIRHDRGGEIVIFGRWQPAQAALDAKRKDWLKLVYSSRSVAVGDAMHASFWFLWHLFAAECRNMNLKQTGRSLFRRRLETLNRHVNDTNSCLVWVTSFFFHASQELHSCLSNKRPSDLQGMVAPNLCYLLL